MILIDLILSFQIQNGSLDFFAGGHFVFHAKINGRWISRKYTPISPVNEKGKSVYIIKIYRKHPDWPGKGLFTQYLEDSVNVGDNIICEGPVGKCRYNGFGKFLYCNRPLPLKRNFGLLSAGTGITPGYTMALASSLL